MDSIDVLESNKNSFYFMVQFCFSYIFYFAIKQNDNAYVVRKKSYTVSEGLGSEQEIK